ncbi:MAG: HlyD family efflux transporter periplasmic adaptor subunit [Candidatus Gracilibacteria bacterium]|nr:HlyD family efflux transporter periplasmic adaptor subunit [Candidatus Gracilibacteria bacterium]
MTYKEQYNDAENIYNILIKSQDEKIESIKKNIEKQKEVINLRNSSYNVVNSLKNEKIEDLELELEKGKSDKSLLIKKLQAELETIKQSKKLLIANENRNITSIKNEIAVAKSNLNNEYIASGDYKIISPFSGVISKRNINIGEKISKNIESFRLTQVENSLSKITKKEIKFFVPESLKDSIDMNKEIIFTVGNNKSKSFTGTIHRISEEIDDNNFSITVQAKVDENIKIPNKSTIRVTIETTKEIFKIPTTAIYNKEERKIIYYKKENGKFDVKDISIISDDGEYSLVSGDLMKT